MNKIVQAMNVRPTLNRGMRIPPINFKVQEKIIDTPMTLYEYQEYSFEAKFGCRHMISQKALKDEASVLEYIRRETAYKINQEIFGEYAKQLRELYIELMRDGEFDKADRVNKIAIDMMEV